MEFLLAPLLVAATQITPQSQWFCTADGYDWNNQLRIVSGDYMPTRPEAETSALNRCSGLNYTGCAVRSCNEFEF